MHITRLVALACSIPVMAQAQLTEGLPRTRTPILYPLSSVGTIPGKDIVMSCTYVQKSAEPVLARGRIVSRLHVIGDDTYTTVDTLKQAVYTDSAMVVSGVHGLKSFDALIYPDKDTTSRLRVNPLLFTRDSLLACGGKALTAVAVRDSVSFFYDLENRQSLKFRSRSVALGVVTIPLRLRMSYDAGAKGRVTGGALDDPGVGVFIGRAIDKLEYSYLEGRENAVVPQSRVAFGLFSLLSKVTLDSTSTSSSVEKVTLPTVSAGPALLMNMSGVDVGLFVAPEFAFGGRSAGSWNFQRKWWVGLGVSWLSLLGKGD